MEVQYLGLDPEARDYIAEAIHIRDQAEHDRARLLENLRGNAAQRIHRSKNRIKAHSIKQSEKKVKAIWESKLEEIQGMYLTVTENANEDLLELALRIAKEVIDVEVENNSSSLASRISSELDNLLEQKKIKILVNSDDYDTVRNEIQEFSELSIMTSPTVCRGDTIIQTAAGGIELSIDKHLNIIAESLRSKVTRSTCASNS